MVWVQGTGTHYTESTPGRYLSEPQGRSYRVTIVTMPPAGLPRLNKHELCWTISGLHLTKYMGHCTACTAIGQAKMFRTNSSMKGPLLVHRVLGAGAEIHFNSFFIQAKLGFPLLMHLCALLMITQV